MKDHLKMDRRKAKEKFHSIMVIITKVGGIKMTYQDTVSTILLPEIHIKGNFKEAKEAVQELTRIRMEINIAVSGRMILRRVKGEFKWLQVIFTKVNGRVAQKVEQVNTSLQTGICMWEHFIME